MRLVAHPEPEAFFPVLDGGLIMPGILDAQLHILRRKHTPRSPREHSPLKKSIIRLREPGHIKAGAWQARISWQGWWVRV